MDEILFYTVRKLLQFIGETGVKMDTKLKIAGNECYSMVRHGDIHYMR